MSAEPVRTERRGLAQLRRRRRLLLVDDDAWCRGIADGVLRGRGYRVFCTGDVRTAVSIAREMLPDLVLADVGLSLVERVPFERRRRADRTTLEPPASVSSGYVILRPLGADPALASTPVILVGDQGDAGQDALRWDVPDHVPKPFTAQILLNKVERCLPRTSLEGARPAGNPAPAASAGKVAPASKAAAAPGWNPGEVVMEGAIDFIGVGGVLEMLHSNQLTGVCSLRTDNGLSVQVGFEDGEIVSASTSEGLQGPEAVYDALTWPRGRFAFGLARPIHGTIPHARFERMMLEAARRLDEGLRRPVNVAGR